MTDVMTPAQWLEEDFERGRGNGWVMRHLMELVDDISENAVDGMRWFPPRGNRNDWYRGAHPAPVDIYVTWCPEDRLPEPAEDFTFGPEYVTAPVTAS